MSSQNFKSSFRDSISFKMLIIGGLVLLLMIPSFMIESLIKERMHRKNTVLNEITTAWSNPQTLTVRLFLYPITNIIKIKRVKPKVGSRLLMFYRKL